MGQTDEFAAGSWIVRIWSPRSKTGSEMNPPRKRAAKEDDDLPYKKNASSIQTIYIAPVRPTQPALPEQVAGH
jgi:hypothetical protein